jgi:hypothetical protein
MNAATRSTSTAPAPAPPPPTYRVATWDPQANSPRFDLTWNFRFTGLTHWQLRNALRQIRAMGYVDEISYLVEREP